MKRLLSAVAVALLVPFETFAAFGNIRTFITTATELVNMLIILAVGVAVLVFFWGLAKFIRNADNSKSHEEGRSLMVWGVVALFVISTVGGLVFWIQQELGINPQNIRIIQI